MLLANPGTKRCGLSGAMLAVLLASPAAIAQDRTSDAKQKTAQRLEASRRAVELIKGYRVDRGDRRRLELLPGPLTSFQALVQYTDGTTWAWGDDARPQAFLSLAVTQSGNWIYEFISLTNDPLVLDTGYGSQWTPWSDWELKPISKAPAPADTARRRMTQMKSLARRFSGYGIDYFIRPDGDRFPLRLLSQPIYRYPIGKHQTATDGALFLFCRDTNPEVLLVIETQRTANSAGQWHFACRRITANRVTIELDGEAVWERMNIEFRDTSSNDSYWIHLRPLDPDLR